MWPSWYAVSYWAMKLLLIGVFIALTACTGNSGDAVATTLQCGNCREAQVLKVIDGDTLDTDLGRIRLFGVQSPEFGQRCASEATERLQELAGDSVRLQSGPRLTDESGRPLAYLYTKGGNSIDETLIREGLAEAWVIDGQHRDHLFGLEREARTNKVGCLW